MTISHNFTIPFDQPFLPTFVRNLLDGNIIETVDFRIDPAALENLTLILPTQRAIKSLRSVFLYEIESEACILPRMIALGGLEDQTDIVLEGVDASYLSDIADIPPPIATHLRNLILARLIQSWAQKFDVSLEVNPLDGTANLTSEDPTQKGRKPRIIGSNPNDALSLARQLSKVMDIFEHHGLSGDSIINLLPEEYQSHWQVIAEFLTLINAEWPKILNSIGHISPVARQVALLDKFSKRITDGKMPGPVVILGSLGEQPATTRLIKAVANNSQGYVVVPGLDRYASDVVWQAENDGICATASHPQHALGKLLADLDLNTSDFLPLIYSNNHLDEDSDRFEIIDQLLSKALSPAGHTESWAEQISPESFENLEQKLAGFKIIDAPDDAVHARMIAMVMANSVRHIDDHKETQLTALITPDRALALRVSIELHRWGLEVDDTAGMKMLGTPAGIFFRLVAEVVANKFSAVSLLALLKHPLMSAGQEVYETRLLVRELEMSVLRGPKIGPGIENIQRILSLKKADAISRNKDREIVLYEKLEAFLSQVEGLLAPLLAFDHSNQAYPVGDILNAHLDVIKAIEAVRQADPLFKFEDGIALADEIDAVSAAARTAAFDVTIGQYPQAICQLMEERPVRVRRPKHPHLFIMGPLEARLHHFDTVILAGLNEGVWPRDVTADPWLSRPMRSDLGVPLPEFEIGLSAHDWCQSFSAKNIIFSRSQKVEGSPSVPSRWLQRLMTVVPDDIVAQMKQRGQALLDQAIALDISKHVTEQKRSAPKPPANLRPMEYAVTSVEALANDPYSLFARQILKLSKVNPLDESPNMGDKGSLFHAILHEYFSSFWQENRVHNVQTLLEIGQKHFAKYDPFPAIRALWWPRFCVVANWLINFERSLKQPQNILTEIKGITTLSLPSGTKIKLTGRADRIDVLEGSRLKIIDYKTGTPPNKNEIWRGTQVQLPLEAIVALQGGFKLPVTGNPKIAELSHYLLKGRENLDAVNDVHPKLKTGELDEALLAIDLEAVRTRAENLIDASLDEDWAYHVAITYEADPDRMPFLHLSRMEAWLAAGGSS